MSYLIILHSYIIARVHMYTSLIVCLHDCVCASLAVYSAAVFECHL